MLSNAGGLKDTRSVAGGTGSRPPVSQAEGETPSQHNVTVGILPMGTSNDFAATTGIPQVGGGFGFTA